MDTEYVLTSLGGYTTLCIALGFCSGALGVLMLCVMTMHDAKRN
jgi:hypothetical protein